MEKNGRKNTVVRHTGSETWGTRQGPASRPTGLGGRMCLRQSTRQLRANLALTPDLQTQTLGSVSSDTPDTSGTGLLVSPKPAPSAGFPVESAPAPSSARNLAACSGLLADPTSDVSEQSGGPCLTHTAHLQPGRPHHPQDLCPLSLSWIAAVASSGVPASPRVPPRPTAIGRHSSQAVLCQVTPEPVLPCH